MMDTKVADFRTFKPSSRNQTNKLKIDGKRVMRASQAVKHLDPGPHNTVCLYPALCNRVSFFWLTLRHSGSGND